MTPTEEQPPAPEQPANSQSPVDPKLTRRLAQRAADESVEPVGPNGLFQQLTKQVLEAGLEVEIGEHLGHDKHEVAGRNGENSRNDTRPKTVTTEVGPVELDVPRDRDGATEIAATERLTSSPTGGPATAVPHHGASAELGRSPVRSHDTRFAMVLTDTEAPVLKPHPVDLPGRAGAPNSSVKRWSRTANPARSIGRG